MKLKINLVIPIVAVLLFAGCSEDYIAEYCPANDGDDWLTDMIRGFKRSDQKVEVYYYEYYGSPVFSINSCIGCADGMTTVYNCDKGVVCQFGGIAGLNTCPDFPSKATGEKLIYKNF